MQAGTATAATRSTGSTTIADLIARAAADELGDAAGLPRLLAALRAAGFAAGEVRAIAWDNWRRVLERAWAG